jgi:hypothetical protein
MTFVLSPYLQLQHNCIIANYYTTFKALKNINSLQRKKAKVKEISEISGSHGSEYEIRDSYLNSDSSSTALQLGQICLLSFVE